MQVNVNKYDFLWITSTFYDFFGTDEKLHYLPLITKSAKSRLVYGCFPKEFEVDSYCKSNLIVSPLISKL